METTDLPASGTAASEPEHIAATGGGLLLAVFASAIFFSAALLFLMQPMFTKMVLPRFGGAPAVWSVAIVFFQGALLVGYAYAHALTRYAGGTRSVVIHMAVMIAACFSLPLSIATGWGRPPATGEALWLLGLFTVSIGLPFFALAANSPLLQAWVARTRHPAAKDPYFLYAGSNIGSFLALLSYPVVIEPFVRLADQARFWSLGFYLLIALIAACGALLWRFADKRAPDAAQVDASAPPSWWDAASWVMLAAVPSALLVAVTAHISTDVASVPLLWVLPLALYLLTFVIVFQRRPIIPHWLVVEVQPLFIIALMAVIIFDPEPVKNIVALIAVHLAVFFVCALVCHGELAARRPPPKDLTSFYLWMSAGGVIGGISARTDRAARVQLGGGISDPARARSALPARPGAADRSASALRALWRLGGGADPAFHQQQSPGGPRHDDVQLDGRGAAWRVRAGLARAASVCRDRRLHPARQSCHRRAGGGHIRAQLLWRRQDLGNCRRPVSSAAARHHAAWRSTHPRGRRPTGHWAGPSCCSITGMARP